MTFASEKDLLKLQQLGKQYAGDALKFFGEKHSQKPEIREVAIFYATATAAMAEAMYSFLSANAEKAQADGWLVQLFGTIGKSLQAKRIPVPPALDAAAGEISVPAAAADQAAPRTGTPKCVCQMDPSGICPACPAALKASLRKALIPVGDSLRLLQQGLGKVGGEKPCQVCVEAYLDAAVASVLMEGSLGELSPEIEPFAAQIFEAIYEWAASRGVEGMELTEKAWAVFSDRMAEDEAPQGK